MSQITIAAAVLAGLAIADRLTELEIQDDQLAVLIGDLAGSLGAVMDMSKKVDVAIGVCQRALADDNTITVYEGLTVIKSFTADLVADQDKIEAAMGFTVEDKILADLLQSLGLVRR